MNRLASAVDALTRPAADALAAIVFFQIEVAGAGLQLVVLCE